MAFVSFPSKAGISQKEVEKALDSACEQVKKNIPLFTGSCQNHSSVKGFYPKCENIQWTCGFWPGEIWLAYERTENPVFREEAEQLVKSFYDRILNKIEVDHHDMGFLYSPSCVASYKLTGNETAKKAAVMAADQLISRFQPKGGFIQAWGKKGERANYRYIIDCLLNLPLLYWASEITGDSKYSDIANIHIKTCLKNSFREDFSTYHTFFMNPETGEPDHGATCQGFRDDSFWARGQAWAIYGIALAYRYVKQNEYLSLFDNVSSFFLNRLPNDLVPYWDLVFTNGSNEPRD
nr:glycoside hydrolase family 88 protein [Treponemataceae bacterium]